MAVWSYEGRRAVVIGCSSGMGEACAAELVRLGAEVHGADIKPSVIAMSSFTKVDLRDLASIEAAAASVDGAIDALFNCAGLPQTFPAVDVVTVNFVGIRHWTEQWIPRIRPGGAIAGISSTAGLGFRERLAQHQEFISIADFSRSVDWLRQHSDRIGDGYSFSKELLNVWVQQQCVPLAERQVRINAILPGPTQTPMMDDFERVAGSRRIDVFTAPTFRRSRPEEQAQPLIFLNSGVASFVSGVCLPVDGGFTGGVSVGAIDLAALRQKAAEAG